MSKNPNRVARRWTKLSAAAASVAILLTGPFSPQSAHAATFFWDNNTNTAGFGTASGTWDTNLTSGGRWSTSSDGTLGGSFTQATALTDSFNFGSTTDGLGGGSITVGTAVAGNLTYASLSGAIVLTGGTLTLAAAQTTTVNNASDTISSTLAGAATSFTKAGTGTLILSGANTFSGASTISAGTLTLNNSLALQNSAFNTLNSIAGTSAAGLKTTVTTLTFGGLTGNKDFASVFTTTSGGYDTVTALTLNPGANVTNSYSGVIVNGAAGMTLTKTGLGTQVLSGANTYTGTTTVNAGVLAPTIDTALPGYTTAGKVVFNGGTIGTKIGDGSTTGWTIAQVETLLANATKTSGGLGIDTSNGNLTQWTNFTTAYFGALGLTKFGANTLTLDQANTYTGATNIAGGTLVLSGGNNRLPSTGTVNFTGGNGSTATFDMGSTSQTLSTITIPSGLTTTQTINIAGTNGTLTVNGNSTLLLGPTFAGSGTPGTTIDMSGLTNFVYNSSTQAFRVGHINGGGTSGNTTLASSVTLATGTNTIITSNLAIGDQGSGGGGGVSTLHRRHDEHR